MASLQSTNITGALGVGVAAPATSGQIKATDDIIAFTSSDKNLKENITEISEPLSKIDKIRGVNFDWKDEWIEKNGGEDEYFVQKHDIGVIAQEIREVIPEAVRERTDGTLAVSYERIIPLLIESIRELKNKVELLEK